MSHLAAMLLTLTGSLMLVDPLAAQFLNRAVYLGRDEEGIRRGIDQDGEYLLSRFSYLPAPWWRDGLDPFGNVFEVYGGSVTSDLLTLEGRVHLRHDLSPDVAAHFHYLQSETRDTQFLRSGVEFEFAAGEEWSAFAVIEGTADKSVGDLSFGVFFHDEVKEAERPDHGLRLMLTSVDFVGNKSEFVRYTKDAYGLMLSGFLGRDGETQLGFELGSQLPAEIDETDINQRFSIERHIGRVETRIPLGGRDWLNAEVELEYTEKRLEPAGVLNPRRESFRREYASIRAEWWRRFQSGSEFSSGILAFHDDEKGTRPNDTSNSFLSDRDEYYGLARGRLMFDEKWALEPSIWAGYAEVIEQLGGSSTAKFVGFQGKAGLGLSHRFSENAVLMLNMTAEIDRASFSGANVQFRSTF